MKKLLYLFLGISLFACDSEVIIYTTGTESDIGGVLNGMVKSYTLNTYNATSKFGEVIKGTEKESSIFSSFETKTHKYNDVGNLIERTTVSGDSYINDYDENGNTIGYSVFDSVGVLSLVWKYELDDEFNIINSSSFNPNGELNYRTTNLYNAKGQNYESIQYDKAGSLSRKTERLFDDKGNISEQIQYDNNLEISSKHIYKYDSITAKKIEEKYFKSKTYVGDKSTAKYIHSYLLRNTLITKKFDEWYRRFTIGDYSRDVKINIYDVIIGEYWEKKIPFHIRTEKEFEVWATEIFPIPYKKISLEKETRYNYNSKSDLILDQVNEALKEYKYDYDESENWVVKYEYENGIIKYITERNIEYFKSSES